MAAAFPRGVERETRPSGYQPPFQPSLPQEALEGVDSGAPLLSHPAWSLIQTTEAGSSGPTEPRAASPSAAPPGPRRSAAADLVDLQVDEGEGDAGEGVEPEAGDPANVGSSDIGNVVAVGPLFVEDTHEELQQDLRLSRNHGHPKDLSCLVKEERPGMNFYRVAKSTCWRYSAGDT